jgi:hypothetical protein
MISPLNSMSISIKIKLFPWDPLITQWQPHDSSIQIPWWNLSKNPQCFPIMKSFNGSFHGESWVNRISQFNKYLIYLGYDNPIWLLVWNIDLIFPFSWEWNNYPDWLSVHHFSGWGREKPPTSHDHFSWHLWKWSARKIGWIASSRNASPASASHLPWRDGGMNQPPVGMVPSGKRLHNYGTSPCLMGKSTISTGPFSIANC